MSLTQHIAKWIGSAIADKALEPWDDVKSTLAELQATVAKLDETVRAKHADDPIAKECDLATLDDRICAQIAKCREKGYTTAEERRRVTRMHEAYKARGGNHGEENEYARFCQLPSEEAWRRLIDGK